jgi:hypothetical protein
VVSDGQAVASVAANTAYVASDRWKLIGLLMWVAL